MLQAKQPHRTLIASQNGISVVNDKQALLHMLCNHTKFILLLPQNVHLLHNFSVLACQLTEQDMDILLSKLLSAGLIKLSDKGDSRDIQVYTPTRDSSDVSLLDILEATGEHLDCNHPTTEEFHMRYGKAAQKLGIVNYITREYLKEIKLFEL